MPVLKPVACAQDQDSNSVSHSAMLGSTQNRRVAMVRLPWGPRRWAFWDSISIYFGVMISLSQVSQFLSSYVWLVSCLHLGRIIGGLVGTKLDVNHFLQMGRRKWKRVYTCVYYLVYQLLLSHENYLCKQLQCFVMWFSQPLDVAVFPALFN